MMSIFKNPKFLLGLNAILSSDILASCCSDVARKRQHKVPADLADNCNRLLCFAESVIFFVQAKTAPIFSFVQDASIAHNRSF